MNNVRINMFEVGDEITPIDEAIYSNNSFFHDKKDKKFIVAKVRPVDLAYMGFQAITIKSSGIFGSIVDGEFYASAFKKV